MNGARGILPEAIQAAGVISRGFTFFDHFYMMPVRPMDYEQFGIDAGLAEALGAFDPVRAAIFDRIMEMSAGKGENLYVRLAVSSGREELLLMPICQALRSGVSGEGGKAKALFLAPDERALAAFVRVAASCAEALGFETASLGAAPDVVAKARLLAATPEVFLAAADSGLVEARTYGILALDGGERIAELPGETLHALVSSLLPSWERKTIFACSHMNTKTRNLAWDLADNPSELHLDENIAKAQGIEQKTWRLPSEAKLRFLLGFLERGEIAKACIFCNLESSADLLISGLAANGLSVRGVRSLSRDLRGSGRPDARNAGKSGTSGTTDITGITGTKGIAGAERFAPGAEMLVLSDQGAIGLDPKPFANLINFDIPLEPEAYLNRLDWVDRAAPGAGVTNLACERYDYGLPAIERLIGVGLAAVEADPSLFSYEDFSVRVPGSREREKRGDSREGVRGDVRRPPQARWKSSRGNEGHEDSNAPDIRRTVAEAAGGMVQPASPAKRPVPGSPPPENRSGEPKKRKQSNASGQKRLPQKPVFKNEADSGRIDRNPYGMTTEERMKAYREKYGNLAGRMPERRSGPVQSRRPAREPERKAERKPMPQRAPERAPERAAPERTPERAPEPLCSEVTEKNGFLGRLTGLFKKKGE